jgi:hypothetical protein
VNNKNYFLIAPLLFGIFGFSKFMVLVSTVQRTITDSTFEPKSGSRLCKAPPRVQINTITGTMDEKAVALVLV